MTVKRRGYTEAASRQLEGERRPPRPDEVSNEQTPWAVLCDDHGQIFLTKEGYTRQMLDPDSLWVCPACGKRAHFDDENYEKATYPDE